MRQEQQTPESRAQGGCASSLVWDRYLRGQLPPAELETRKAHLESCPRCRAHVEKVEAQRREVAEKPLPSWLENSKNSPRPRTALIAVAATLGLAILSSSTLHQGALDTNPSIVGDELRPKGSNFGAYVARGGQVVRLEPDAQLREGDALRFFYSATQARYLAIIDEDGQGSSSQFFPESSTAARVPPGEHVLLDHAIVLDDAVGHETIHAIFCDRPFAIVLPLAELKSKLDPACLHMTLSFEKLPSHKTTETKQ